MQDSVFRDALLKAIGPTVGMVVVLLAALLPLYVISQSYLSRSSQSLPAQPLR